MHRPDDRWQSASDLAYELRSIRELPAGGAATTTPRRGLNAWWLIGGVAAILAAIAMGTLLRPRAERPPVNELRLSVVPPDGYEFAGDAADFDPDFDVSPDGRQLVFAAMNRAGKRTLWVRDLGTTAARELADTDGAHRPFWSPDGRSVGFTASAGMTRVAIDGASSPKAIGSMLAGDRNTSASWGSKGQIIFDATTREGAASGAKKLFTIPESGGKTEPVPRGNPPPDEQRSAIPCFSATVGTFFI